MSDIKCPKCQQYNSVKSGVVNQRQRYKCKPCNYFFTVDKIGKSINNYYVTKALQLYIEGLSYREIERILGISHVSVMNWVKKYKLSRPEQTQYHPSYKIYTHAELLLYLGNKDNIGGSGMIITELADKFMVIKWERFRE